MAFQTDWTSSRPAQQGIVSAGFLPVMGTAWSRKGLFRFMVSEGLLLVSVGKPQQQMWFVLWRPEHGVDQEAENGLHSKASVSVRVTVAVIKHHEQNYL